MRCRAYANCTARMSCLRNNGTGRTGNGSIPAVSPSTIPFATKRPGHSIPKWICRIRTRTRSRNVLCAAKRGGDTGHVRRFGKIRVHSPGDDIRGIRQYLRQGKVRKSGGMDKNPAAVVLFHPPGIQPVQQEEFMDQGRMLFPHRRKEAA